MSPVRTLRVLLLEDNPHVSKLITDGLEGAASRAFDGLLRFAFEVVTDGKSALAAALREPPDLVISDIYTPVMDGATFLRELRASAAAKIPVLALSAGGPSARRDALSAGADLFIDKPVRLQELLLAVDQLLKLNR